MILAFRDIFKHIDTKKESSAQVGTSGNSNFIDLGEDLGKLEVLFFANGENQLTLVVEGSETEGIVGSEGLGDHFSDGLFGEVELGFGGLTREG